MTVHEQINVTYRKRVLKDPTHLDYLHEFQQQYYDIVLVPVDKAGNNALVVCKKYIVIKELSKKGKNVLKPRIRY